LQLLNFLLSSLSPSDIAALMPALAETSLTNGQVLFEPGDAVHSVYFPGSACLSVVTIMEDGRAVETATVGRESAVGLLDVLTDEPSHSRVFAQVAGSATRLPAPAFGALIANSPTFLKLVLRHARANVVQAEQGVACNIAHEVHGRLARWLLMTQDRVGAATFPLTQEYMSVMTGVQRSTVSVMAGALKKAGVISYSRGFVTILKRDALIAHACECYGVVGRQFEALRNIASAHG
jgi:CRP-like cAMP-binding protein